MAPASRTGHWRGFEKYCWLVTKELFKFQCDSHFLSRGATIELSPAFQRRVSDSEVDSVAERRLNLIHELNRRSATGGMRAQCPGFEKPGLSSIVAPRLNQHRNTTRC